MKTIYSIILLLIFSSCAKQYGTPLYVSTDSVQLDAGQGDYYYLDSLLRFDKSTAVFKEKPKVKDTSTQIKKPHSLEQDKVYSINTTVINKITIVVDTALKNTTIYDTLLFKKDTSFSAEKSIKDTIVMVKSYTPNSVVKDTSIRAINTDYNSPTVDSSIIKNPVQRDVLIDNNPVIITADSIKAKDPVSVQTQFISTTKYSTVTPVNVIKTQKVSKVPTPIDTKIISSQFIEDIRMNNTLLKDKKVVKTFTFYYAIGSETAKNYISIFDSIQSVLTAHQNVFVLLAGFTDKSGDPSKNLILSNRRAERIREALVLQGLSSKDIYSQFFGEEYATAEKSISDRKVECIILEKPVTEDK